MFPEDPPLLREVQRIGFLGDLPEPLLRKVSESAMSLALHAGETLFEPGDTASKVYFVRRGCVALGMRTVTGDEHIVGLIGPTDLLNVLALGEDAFTRENRKQALAVVDTELLALPAEALREVIRADGKYALRVIAYLASRIADLTQQVMQQSNRSVLWRVAHCLLVLVDKLGRTQVPLTHATLALLTGANRVTVSEALGILQQNGWVTTGRGRVQVRDVPGLKQFLEHST